MTDNRAQALASGIRNIDRMQEDIKSVVSAIARCYSITRGQETHVEFPRHPMVAWKFFQSFGDSPPWWGLRHRGVPVVEVSGRQVTFRPPALILVATMHMDLNELVGGMMEKFPRLEEDLKPFFDAAELSSR